MNKLLALSVLTLLLTSCATGTTKVSDVDGCQTYRVSSYAGLEVHYFTKCKDGVVKDHEETK